MAEGLGLVFYRGDVVEKVTGDYKFIGVVVAAFFKRDKLTRRYVVENDDGVLFILNSSQLKKIGEV